MVKGTLRKGSFAKVTGDRRDAATSGDINRPPEYMEQLPLHVMAIADAVLVCGRPGAFGAQICIGSQLARVWRAV